MDRRHFIKLAAALPFASVRADMKPLSKGKRGIGIVAKPDGKWLERINALKVDWFYTWGGGKPADVPASVDFIPMIWGYWGDRAGIAKTGAAAKDSGIRELLGFNEPDQRSQSNVSVAKALDAWPELMKTGLRLGSPGCVHPDSKWMQAFMKGVDERKLRVDFICIHSYGGTDAKAFMNQIEKIHKMYERPIWITEFACADWGVESVAQNRHKPPSVLKFMQQVLPYLDRASFVERYAWFPASTGSAPLGTSALYDKSGNLTELGKHYRSA